MRDVRHRHNQPRFAHADDDAIELVDVRALTLLLDVAFTVILTDLEFPRRRLDVALCHEGTVTESEQHGTDGNVDIHVRIANAEPLHRFLADASIFEDANHCEPNISYLDPVTDGLVGRKESRPHPVTDDRDWQPLLNLQMGEPLALGEGEVREHEVGGIDADELAGPSKPLAGEEGVEHDFGARHFHCGDRVGDGGRVLVRETRRESLYLSGRLLFDLLLSLFHERRHHHIVRS